MAFRLMLLLTLHAALLAGCCGHGSVPGEPAGRLEGISVLTREGHGLTLRVSIENQGSGPILISDLISLAWNLTHGPLDLDQGQYSPGRAPSEDRYVFLEPIPANRRESNARAPGETLTVVVPLTFIGPVDLETPGTLTLRAFVTVVDLNSSTGQRSWRRVVLVSQHDLPAARSVAAMIPAPNEPAR